MSKRRVGSGILLGCKYSPIWGRHLESACVSKNVSDSKLKAMEQFNKHWKHWSFCSERKCLWEDCNCCCVNCLFSVGGKTVGKKAWIEESYQTHPLWHWGRESCEEARRRVAYVLTIFLLSRFCSLVIAKTVILVWTSCLSANTGKQFVLS